MFDFKKDEFKKNLKFIIIGIGIAKNLKMVLILFPN